MILDRIYRTRSRAARGLRAGLMFMLLVAAVTAGAAPGSPTARDIGVTEAALLDTGAETDVISPLGLYQAICAIRPMMSSQATRQVDTVLGDVCRAKSTSSATSVWLADSIPLQSDIGAAVSVHGELHRVAAPMNRPIAKWLRDHDVPVVGSSGAVVFASVNAVNYNEPWRLPFSPTPSKPRPFYGRNRTVSVRFVEGHSSGWVEREPKCERVVLPTTQRGSDFVIISAVGPDVRSAIACVERPVSSTLRTAADVMIPVLDLRTLRSLQGRLERRGVTAIFDASANPFEKVVPHLGLSQLLQGIAFHLDETGVSVKATTIANVSLSGPKPGKYHAVFNHPFVMRVVDAAGNTVALGSIEDLHG